MPGGFAFDSTTNPFTTKIDPTVLEHIHADFETCFQRLAALEEKANNLRLTHLELRTRQDELMEAFDELLTKFNAREEIEPSEERLAAIETHLRVLSEEVGLV